MLSSTYFDVQYRRLANFSPQKPITVNDLGPVPERRNNSIPGINVPYFRDNFIPRINFVPGRRNSAIQGINPGKIYYTLRGGNKSLFQG